MNPKTFRIAVCASGQGSNFAALAHATRLGVLRSQVVLLLASKPEIGAIERATELQIPVEVLKSKEAEARDQEMCFQLKKSGADLIILAGFLQKIGPATLAQFPRRILNLHPGALPKYGGQGMYGRRVHAAVLAAGERETLITLHVVDAHYDHGPAMATQAVQVMPGDSVEELAERVKAQENAFIVNQLKDLEAGRLQLP